ncbi:PAS domain S-box protein [Rapidithrix thailandica]|uniref:PAS domain S-box protein n=1 Tax=Rapidithrix thailandica TaxID=413964 RepID=A0AAW9S4K7_9BACT
MKTFLSILGKAKGWVFTLLVLNGIIFLSTLKIVEGYIPFLKDNLVHIALVMNLAIVGRIIWRISRQVAQVFSSSNQLLAEVSHCSAHKQKKKQDIYTSITDNLNNTIFKIKEASQLIDEISKGEQIHLDKLSHEDRFGKAILNLESELHTFKQREAERQWGIESVAKFSEILHQEVDKIEEMCFSCLKSLIKMLGCNQGMFYLVKTDRSYREFLELAAAYAFDRKKYLSGKVYPGEGLVGQCLQEKDLIYLTDIPPEYIKITSGLGDAPPTNIIIAPLLFNDAIFGVIELASFKVLPQHKVDFIRKVTESIASSIHNLEANLKTKKLLEESQLLTAELRENEEEMRQNFEELSATQEEMSRKQLELDSIVSAIDTTLCMVEVDPRGRILKANKNTLSLLAYTSEQLYKVHYKEVFKNYSHIQKIINQTQQAYSDDLLVKTRQGKDVWLHTTYNPVKDQNGDVHSVLMLAQDITRKKTEEIEFERLSLVADNTDTAVVITDHLGYVEYVNRGFTRISGFTLKEMLGKKPGNILQGPETCAETQKRISWKLKQGESIYEEILNYNKQGEKYWISLSINPVKDDHGTVVKYIAVQAEITETKTNALNYKSKLEAISRSSLIIEVKKDKTITEVNDNFLEVFGYSLREIQGQAIDLLQTTIADEEQQTTWWEKIMEGQFIRCDFNMKNKYDHEICLRGVFNPIFDLQGGVESVVIYANNITVEKHLEIKNRQNKVELNYYLEAINKTIASVEFDMKGRIKEVNPIYLSVMGYTREELVGHSYEILLDVEENEKPQIKMMWENLKNGQFFSGEFKHKSKSGKDLWLNGTFNPILDIAGVPRKIMLLAQFTTAEKEKQHDLSNTLAAYKSVVPTLELKEGFIIKSFNQGFLELLGYTRMDLRNKSLEDILAERAAGFESLLKKVSEGKNETMSLKFLTKKGKTLQKQVRFFPILNLEHTIGKTVLIVQ